MTITYKVLKVTPSGARPHEALVNLVSPQTGIWAKTVVWDRNTRGAFPQEGDLIEVRDA